MLFLIPPSETKAAGGRGLSIAQVALTFGGLNSARERVYGALVSLCADESAAAKALGLSATQLGASANNLAVQDAPVMPAIDRYEGTLYDAIHDRGLKGTPTADNRLGAAARARAKEIVLIQSSLFGLIPATDLIPDYRLSAGTRLPALRESGETMVWIWSAAHEPIWRRLAAGPIIDRRSKAYAELAPVPADLDCYELDVDLEKADGTRERMNHFNKKAKGQLLNAVLTAANAPETLAELADLALLKGLRLEVDGRRLTLVTFE